MLEHIYLLCGTNRVMYRERPRDCENISKLIPCVDKWINHLFALHFLTYKMIFHSMCFVCSWNIGLCNMDCCFIITIHFHRIIDYKAQFFHYIIRISSQALWAIAAYLISVLDLPLVASYSSMSLNFLSESIESCGRPIWRRSSPISIIETFNSHFSHGVHK